MKVAALLSASALVACATAGNNWVNQPLDGSDDESLLGGDAELPPGARRSSPPAFPSARTIGQAPAPAAEAGPGVASGAPKPTKADVAGKTLGTFRNTYYDFPSELDFEGQSVELKSPKCETIASVKRPFFEAVCVQGSGTVAAGATVSFAKRDCECAELCPRTGQKICFDLLDPKQFPWGRGATGKAITPLLTVAVDADVIPLGTPIYVPEYDGLPRDPEEKSLHDGCFVAQDRGLKVKGQHLDFFTGHRSMTTLWNRLVPSNRGVTVVVDTPRCARAL